MSRDATNRLGRNIACPCGSGRKYKKCCGAIGRREADAPLPFVAPFTEQDRQSALAQLDRHAADDRFREDRQSASILLFRGALDDLAPEEMQRVLQNAIVYQNFQSFVTIDLDCVDGRTILDCFLAEHGQSLSTGERNYLEALTRTCVRPYEVLEVVRDEGFRLRDLWSNEDQWVSERLATGALVQWDVFGARVMARPDGRRVLEGDLYVFPRTARDRILEELRQAHRSFAKCNPRASSWTFLKRCAAVVLGPIWLQENILRPPPSVTTPEGDEIEFGQGIFAVRDPHSVARELDRSPRLKSESEGRWCWVESADGYERILGTFVLEGHELTIETISRRRMSEGRALIKAAVGEMVQHRSTRYSKPDLSSFRRAEAQQEQQQPQEVPVEVADHLRQMSDQHYHRWIDEPVPALGGLTPRRAASMDSHRSCVAELLRQFENGEARRALKTNEQAYDFGWLWRELGVSRDA